MKKGEDALLEKIERHFSRDARGVAPTLRVGIGDDAAILSHKPGYESILTCDWFLEGTHFLRDKHPPDSVGWKCLARALSDVAAMGGVPRCFLLSLALPQTLTGQWLDAFLQGLHRASRKFDCQLAGGDSTHRHEVLISITVVGDLPSGSAVLRSGARPADILYVSGRLGEAELGLNLLRSARGLAAKRDPRLRKHLYPQPRLALGRWLRQKRLATAMMDLSDGLSSDLPRLCRASRVGARIEVSHLPTVHVSPPDQNLGLTPLQLALHGGDDYELLFCVPPRQAKSLPPSWNGVLLTPIGEMTPGHEIRLAQPGGRQALLKSGGWDPFRPQKNKKSD